MTGRDLESLRRLLRGSFNEAERAYHAGYCTESAWRWFLFLWTWSAGRFGGPAGAQHDRAYARLGATLYQRRIERVAALAARLSR